MPFAPYSAGQRLTADAMNLVSMIGATVFQAKRTTAQSFSTNTEFSVSFDQVDIDILSGWTSGSPTKWVCPIAGWYTLQGNVVYNSVTTAGTREAAYFINGSVPTGHRGRISIAGTWSATAAVINGPTVSDLLAVGDEIELRGFSSQTGGSQALATGSTASGLTISFAGLP